MSSTRSVSFVERLELEFNGCVFKEALSLGDVDNDGGNELIVGNVDGELCIFKGDCAKPWKMCRDLGMITCLGVGDVFNKGRNYLVCMTAEGWCHVFDVSRHFGNSFSDLEPVHSQHLATNCKALTLADLDGDGKLELAVAHTDRTVSLYVWDPTGKEALNSNQKSPGTSQIRVTQSDSTLPATPKKQIPTKEESTESTRSSSKESKSSLKEVVKSDLATNQSEEGVELDSRDTNFLGVFRLLKCWTLSGQIGSLVTFQTKTYTNLLVSQPGGSYVILRPEDAINNDGSTVSCLNQKEDSGDKEETEESVFEIPDLSFGNLAVPTDIIALSSKTDISSSEVNRKFSSHVAMCTVDGSIVLLDCKRILWSLEVNGNLFAISKLDINCDGNDELVVCSSDGLTYITDLQQNIIKFKFAENVMSFCAGNFAFTPRNNAPCLVYVTFSNRVIIYHSIKQARVASSNLNVVMASSKSLCQKGSSCIDLEGSSYPENQRQLISRCLYGNL